MIKSVMLRRTILLILVSVLLSGCLSSALYIVIARNLNVRMQAAELTVTARVFAESLAAGEEANFGQNPFFQINPDNKLFGGASLYIFDERGRIVENQYARGPSESGKPFDSRDLADMISADVSEVLSGNEITETRTSRGETWLVVGAPVNQNGHVIGAVIIIRAVSDLNSNMRSLNITLIASTVFAFALMLLPAFFASRRLFVPIRQMQSVALSMSEGDFSVRADESQKGEIGDLARAMNRFAEESGKLEQSRRDYVANVSHELRTPIASIRAMGETLRDGMVRSEEKKELFYNNIVRESMRLSRLVDDLLELSRLQSGTEAMEKSRFDLREVLENLKDMYSHQAEEAGITLDIRIPDTGISVVSNADRIEQVLVVLIDNAFKHTPEGGVVTLSSAKKDKKILVSVHNTGEGIPKEDLPHVFERFYTVDKSRSGGGMGLGLSIAKEIMRGLGETIRAESRQDGAVFSFTLGV